jgi:fibronectin type 3 domain-containing protein
VLRNWIALYLQERREERAAADAVVPLAVPNAPQNLTLYNAGISYELNWLDVSGDETSFRVYRKVDAGSFELFQTLDSDSTGCEDVTVVSGHLYTYYVTAVDDVGESAPSNVVSDTFNPS